MPVVTRFAPSPTGYLHLGHVVNAIFVWQFARARGGEVVLRIEDHDRIRCRPEYVDALLDDLDWLGFVPDRGRDPLNRQSDRAEVYRAALARLRATHHVYACACSRKDIGGEHYPGTCRERNLPDGPGMALRVRFDPGEERVEDLRLGPLIQDPSRQCGDLLLRDRHGHWTYHFCVVVDDMREGITHVIRGEDLVESTGRQVRLARLLGRPTPPVYLHHPLVLRADGQKLSKAAGDSGIRDLRRTGLTRDEVIERAARAVGLTGWPR